MMTSRPGINDRRRSGQHAASPSPWRSTPAARACLAWLVVAAANPGALAERPAHYLFDARQPTGEIGLIQLSIRPELRGYYQPVQIKAPDGALISVADEGGFGVQDANQSLVGLLVGQVYRLRISQIPNYEATDVYPTIELLDRMHPPAGKETRYPIPIEIAPEDLALVINGKYVTRVIYVENPRAAVPARDAPEQRYFEVLPQEDPLHIAGELGRPVAILRMGSLTPGANAPTPEFLFGSPPPQRYATVPATTYMPNTPDARNQPLGETE